MLSSAAKRKIQNFVYPALMLVFAVFVAIILTYAIRFLSGAINMVFKEATQNSGGLLRVNLVDYPLVAKKLGLKPVVEENAAIISEMPSPATTESVVAPPTSTPASTVAATSSASIAPDKAFLKINVLNGTTQSGVAGALKNILESAGFTVDKIGNSRPMRAETAIQIKNSKLDFLPALKEAMSAQYPSPENIVLEEINVYDVIIIIGGK
jgi:hypothetical protein